jgi:hypothetical protein
MTTTGRTAMTPPASTMLVASSSFLAAAFLAASASSICFFQSSSGRGWRGRRGEPQAQDGREKGRVRNRNTRKDAQHFVSGIRGVVALAWARQRPRDGIDQNARCVHDVCTRSVLFRIGFRFRVCAHLLDRVQKGDCPAGCKPDGLLADCHRLLLDILNRAHFLDILLACKSAAAHVLIVQSR